MVERFDVAILGTGLFGSALACHLACDHAQRVLALDVPCFPRGPSATASSAGILSLQGWDPWDLAVVRESRDDYVRIAEDEGAEPLRPNGGLRVARTEAGAAWLEQVSRVLSGATIEVHQLRGAAIGELLPFGELDDVRLGLYTPEDATVAPIELGEAYVRAASRAGASVRSLEAPVPIGSDPGGPWRIGDSNGAVARSLVISAGAWSKALLGGLGHPLPLAPFRAQAVRLRPRPLLGTFPTLHDLDLEIYARPGGHGRVVAGDGNGPREADPFAWDPAADAGFATRTTEGLQGIFRGLDSLRSEAAWAGLCSATPDRFPLVGRVPGARGLYVACGFNGLGTMRAGGLARRLADALQSDCWESLGPADPLRFDGPGAPFDPRPEFPLDAPGGDFRANDDLAVRLPSPGDLNSRAGAPLRLRLLAEVTQVDYLRWSPLSEWFDPFLPLFAKDAIRTGGRVELAEDRGVVRGLWLSGSSEGVGSGFTRERRLAERYLDRAEGGGIYLEQPWRAGGELVEVFAADLEDWEAQAPLRNPIRIARVGELPAIGRLMRAELGAGVDPWLATLPRPEETAFVCELTGRIVGVSWLSRAGRFARGHSFVVHPRFRGLGIGTDLLTARMLWLRRTGGRQVVSEIYDGNRASRTAAERVGMALVGAMFHFRPSPRAIAARATNEGPRSSGSWSPSSR